MFRSIVLNMQAKLHLNRFCGRDMLYDGGMPRKLSKPRPKQGEHLAELRKAANLTQAELAKLVGETQRNIAYWEQSEKPPRSDVLPKLAEILGVEVTSLLGVDAGLSRRRGGLVGKVHQVFEEVSQLPRREQNKVVELVLALVRDYKRRAS